MAAVFGTGAGRFPGPCNYTEYAWQAAGTGQFRPGDNATTYIGQFGALDKGEESRIETLCRASECAERPVKALKKYDYGTLTDRESC